MQELSAQVNGLTLATSDATKSQSASVADARTEGDLTQQAPAPSDGEQDMVLSPHPQKQQQQQQALKTTPRSRRPRRLFPGVNWRERQARFVANMEKEAAKAKAKWVTTLPPIQEAVGEVRALVSNQGKATLKPLAHMSKWRRERERRQTDSLKDGHARRQEMKRVRKEKVSVAEWCGASVNEYTELVSDADMLEAERLAYLVNIYLFCVFLSYFY